MKKKSTKNQIQLIIIVACTIAVVLCAIWLILYLKGSNTTTKKTENLLENYVVVERIPVDGTENIKKIHFSEV